jgi:hypothetical protein
MRRGKKNNREAITRSQQEKSGEKEREIEEK